MCAWENGFSYLSTGCPILIGDGLKGTDEVEVPVAGGGVCPGGEKSAMPSWTPMFISLAHFKGP